MFTIPDPQKKQFSQPNRGDYSGTFWATKNIDIHSEKGRIRPSALTRLTTDTGQRTPRAFLRSAVDGTDRWWAWCGSKLYKTAGTDPTAAFTADSLTNTPTDLGQAASDLVEFGTAIVVSNTIGRLNILVSGTTVWNPNYWNTTLSQNDMSTSAPHPLCVGFNGLLVIGDANKVHTIDKNNNINNTRLLLRSEFEIWKILSSNSEYWFLASNKYSREARVFKWDGSAENFNQDYGVEHPVVFTGALKNEILYVINGFGQLMKFNGSGFGEVAVLPIYGIKNKPLLLAINAYSIQRNGMAVVEGKIHVLVDGIIPNSSGTPTPSLNIENFWGGVWTYDDNEGLIHKYALALYDGTEYSYGSSMFVDPGAIYPTIKNKGVFLAGARLYNYPGDPNGSACIFYVDTTDALTTCAYFITPRLESAEAEEMWHRSLTKFKEFTNSTDRIFIKYRTSRNINLPTSMTAYYTSTTGLSTSGALTNVSVGDEVEFLLGRGEGTTRHISSITGTTIVINEAITNATGTTFVRFQNWMLLDTVNTQSIRHQFSSIDKPGEWIQFKVELRGSGSSPELEQLSVSSKPQIKAQQ